MPPELEAMIVVSDVPEDRIAAAAPAGVVEEPEMAQEEEEAEPEEEAVAEEEEPVAAAQDAEPEAFVAAPVMPAFAEEEEEPAEEVAEQFQPIAPPQEESAMTYAEEPGVAADDGIVSQSQYYDEEAGAQGAGTISEPQQSDEVMATEVAQEPTPVVLPVTFTLEAEPWFDFDRSAVRSDARSKLDELVNGLQGVEYETILVVGHADRIGTQSYNQALSLRRANAVKSYLAGRGIPLDRITTEGRGEFEPSTDPNACTRMRKRKLIDCLQPDRRVEVTVTGQRMAQQ
jgi:outer membrane protein OmpA-like peptidoglycan-associated protein